MIIALITLIFLNLFFLDLLFWGTLPTWKPFFVNPRNWFNSVTNETDSQEAPLPPRRSFLTDFTASIYDTEEQVKLKKEEAFQRAARERAEDLNHIQSLERKMQKSNKWRTNIRNVGLLTISLNLLFMIYMVRHASNMPDKSEMSSQKKK